MLMPSPGRPETAGVGAVGLEQAVLMMIESPKVTDHRRHAGQSRAAQNPLKSEARNERKGRISSAQKGLIPSAVVSETKRTPAR
jgi:hypothetical protein